MANKAVAVGRYNPNGVFEHEVWSPGDSLTDPDGGPLVGGGGAGASDFIDDPDNWEKIPKTKFEAVQSLAYTMHRHIARPLSGGVASGTGIEFYDKTPGVWSPVPAFLIDAIQVLSYEVSNHWGPIPCAGTGVGDIAYTDNPAYWSALPLTYLEAIQCIAAFVSIGIGYEIPNRSVDHNYVDDPNVWNSVPYTQVHAVRSLATELSTHLGASIPRIVGLDSGPPYQDNAALWTPSVPSTVESAIESIANELVAHLGFPITAPPFDPYAYRIDMIYDGNPANWTNVPFSTLLAIQSLARELSVHFSFPVAALGVSVSGGTGNFVTPPPTSSFPGSIGDWSFDGVYIYRCVAPNTWTRFAVITSF